MGKIVDVLSTGKAPTGLSAGTTVKTAGGNYMIDSVNADGSYVSSLIPEGGGATGPVDPGPWQAPEAYTSPYADQIAEEFANFKDMKFEYDPNKDASFQAFLGEAERTSERTFKNQLGSLAAATGGRVSSWASSAASRAQQDIMLSAQAQVGQFEQIAYNRFRDSQQTQLQLLNSLMDMDNIAYGRWVDSVNFQYQAYTSSIDAYQRDLAAIDKRKQDALETAENRGYFNNEEAALWGVQPGTLAGSAKQRADDWADFVRKQEYLLKLDQKQVEATKALVDNAVGGANFNKVYNAAYARIEEMHGQAGMNNNRIEYYIDSLKAVEGVNMDDIKAQLKLEYGIIDVIDYMAATGEAQLTHYDREEPGEEEETREYKEAVSAAEKYAENWNSDNFSETIAQNAAAYGETNAMFIAKHQATKEYLMSIGFTSSQAETAATEVIKAEGGM